RESPASRASRRSIASIALRPSATLWPGFSRPNSCTTFSSDVRSCGMSARLSGTYTLGSIANPATLRKRGARFGGGEAASASNWNARDLEEVRGHQHRHDRRSNVAVEPVQLLFDREAGDVLHAAARVEIEPALIGR